LWETASGRELRQYPKHPGEIRSIIFSPDGRDILVGYDHGSILVWETGVETAKGDSPAKPGLLVPRQLAPKDNSEFDVGPPRKTTLKWAPVAGAEKYKVAIEYQSGGQWTSLTSDKVAVESTEYVIEFPGAQPGRWRVWAVDDTGKEGPKSGWWTFRFTQ
jgi:hypothetical protein